MGRGLIVVLIVSLALNVFAVGFFSGRAISNDGPPLRPAQNQSERIDDPLALMKYAQDLPPEMREAFRGKMREKLPTLRDQHRKTKKLRRELAMLIAADDWDRDAVTAKFAEIKAVQTRQSDEFHAAFVDALETLSADERRRLIEALGKRKARRRPPRERRARPGDQ